MNKEDARAAAEIAFSVEAATSLSLQALLTEAPREIIRMTWLSGYLAGRLAAFADAKKMIEDMGTK
jgi:hypothetical protein